MQVSLSMPGGQQQLDAEGRKRFTEQWVDSIKDTVALMDEVQRLYTFLGRLRDQHLPFAGQPGEPAICTACSLHGAQVPWPCDMYRTITAALPERKP